WDRLLTPELRRRTRTVMDTLDLVTLYRTRFEIMQRYLSAPPFSPVTTHPEILREDFFETLGAHVSPEEFELYDQYDMTIAITASDAALIQTNTAHTQVVTLPMTQEPV